MFVVGGSFLNAQNIFSGYENLFTPVRNYIVYQSVAEIEIDGKANDSSWENATWTEYFIDIEGENKPGPLYRTHVKMLWDDNNLFILAELEEPHVWAYYEKHDMIVFQENDFEVFIDPNGDAQNYFEIEVNAQNTIFDLFMPQPYRNGGDPLIAWNATGLKSAVYIDGTLNNPDDIDKKWTVEMAIPFNALKLGTGNQTPQDNQIWKIDFSRVNWQTEITDGVYKRKTDPGSQRILPEYNWVWSAPGLINMHFPERWGLIQFSTKPFTGVKVGLQNLTDDELDKYLWLAYYKQKKYLAEKGKYAMSLSEIAMPEIIKSNSAETFNIKIFATTYQFMIFLTNENGTKMSINENGLIRK
jgi:hypothetical protein